MQSFDKLANEFSDLKLNPMDLPNEIEVPVHLQIQIKGYRTGSLLVSGGTYIYDEYVTLAQSSCKISLANINPVVLQLQAINSLQEKIQQIQADAFTKVEKIKKDIEQLKQLTYQREENYDDTPTEPMEETSVELDASSGSEDEHKQTPDSCVDAEFSEL